MASLVRGADVEPYLFWRTEERHSGTQPFQHPDRYPYAVSPGQQAHSLVKERYVS
jgi:hypothetical protein